MGLWASIESAHGNKLGLAQYDFYNLYNKVNPATTESAPTGPVYVANSNPAPVTGFRDITVGTNGGCVAQGRLRLLHRHRLAPGGCALDAARLVELDTRAWRRRPGQPGSPPPAGCYWFAAV